MATTTERFTIALAQIAPVLGDVERNVALAERFARQAADQGAALMVLPELALTGYLIEDLTPEVARAAESPSLTPLREASRHLAIVAGFVERGAHSALHNSAAYWEGGDLRAVHRKVYLPTYGLFDEGRFMARGNALGAFDTALGRSALLICEDIWHPSTVYVAAQDGARLIIVPAASPTREAGGIEGSRIGSIWYDLLRTYAVLHGVYLVFVNRVGFEDGVNYWGGSVVYGPDGSERGRAPLFAPGLTFVDVDMADVLRERTRSQHVWEEDADLTLRALEQVLARRAAVETDQYRVASGPSGPAPFTGQTASGGLERS